MAEDDISYPDTDPAMYNPRCGGGDRQKKWIKGIDEKFFCSGCKHVHRSGKKPPSCCPKCDADMTNGDQQIPGNYAKA